MKDDERRTPRTMPLQSATFSNPINAEIRRAAATGIYDIRGGGAKRRVPHFDDLLFLGASVSRYPARGLPREMRHQRHAGHALCEKADQAGHSDHHCGDELWRAVGAGQGSLGARRIRGGNVYHNR